VGVKKVGCWSLVPSPTRGALPGVGSKVVGLCFLRGGKTAPRGTRSGAVWRWGSWGGGVSKLGGGASAALFWCKKKIITGGRLGVSGAAKHRCNIWGWEEGGIVAAGGLGEWEEAGEGGAEGVVCGKAKNRGGAGVGGGGGVVNVARFVVGGGCVKQGKGRGGRQHAKQGRTEKRKREKGKGVVFVGEVDLYWCGVWGGGGFVGVPVCDLGVWGGGWW